jgi:hypothetical protein
MYRRRPDKRREWATGVVRNMLQIQEERERPEEPERPPRMTHKYMLRSITLGMDSL